MQFGPPRRRRARPVADAPVTTLIERAEDLTKGWLLALLEQAPLDDAPAILAADVTRDGPRLCSALVRALASDEDLARLQPGGALEHLVSQTGELAGSVGLEASMRAVEALSGVIWSAVRSSLPDPDPELVSELAERLALVTELVRGAVLRRLEGVIDEPVVPVGSPRVVVPGAPDVPPLREVPPAQEAPPTREEPPAPEEPAFAATAETAPRAELADVQPLTAWPQVPAPPSEPLWFGALEDEVVRAERSGASLSLLLIELEEADHVRAVEAPAEATATFSRFAQAVRSAVRRQDVLACETETRAWVIARDTARLGAQSLGTRIVSAVRAAQPWRGAPMTVSVGLAVFGEDATDCEALVEAAEQARFEAAAGGFGIAGGAVPEAPSHGPRDPGPELVS